MPIFHFSCDACGQKLRRLLRADQVAEQLCGCGELLKRDVRPPSTRTMEVLDNGIMAKRVERIADIERLAEERRKG